MVIQVLRAWREREGGAFVLQIQQLRVRLELHDEPFRDLVVQPLLHAPGGPAVGWTPPPCASPQVWFQAELCARKFGLI